MEETAELEAAERGLRSLNRQIREEHERLGIQPEPDLYFNREDGLRLLAILRNTPTPVHHLNHTTGDELIEAIAPWHKPCLLSQYKDKRNRSYEAQRDLFQPGVYILLELVGSDLAPVFVGKAPWGVGGRDSDPRYVGESKNLSHRLWEHVTGRKSTAANVVMEELLAAHPEMNVDYDRLWPSEQREWREMAMTLRRLWVKTAHTDSKSEAQRLENAVINLYTAMGIPLWNHILYKGRKAWR